MKTRQILRRFVADIKMHPLLHLFTILTIMLSLCVLGAFFLVQRNVEAVAEHSKPYVTGTAFLKSEFSDVEILQMRESILAVPNVIGAEYRSSKDVLADLAGVFGNSSTSWMQLQDIFQHVIEVKLKSSVTEGGIQEAKDIISKVPGVVEVDFSGNYLAEYENIRKGLRTVGLVLMIVTLLGSGFIIANFMGMRHQNRRQEVEIYSLMGAKRSYMLFPFLCEGAVEGLIAAVGATCIVYLGLMSLNAGVSKDLSTYLGASELLFLQPLHILMLLAFGISMAFVGSITVFFKMRRV